MFAVEEKHKRINDKIVETFERSVMGHHTELLAEAGTTGYKGTPCRKAGGRTYLSLVCMEGDFHFEPVTSDDGEIFDRLLRRCSTGRCYESARLCTRCHQRPALRCG